jgi:hypothetical protein
MKSTILAAFVVTAGIATAGIASLVNGAAVLINARPALAPVKWYRYAHASTAPNGVPVVAVDDRGVIILHGAARARTSDAFDIFLPNGTSTPATVGAFRK